MKVQYTKWVQYTKTNIEERIILKSNVLLINQIY